MKSFVFYLGLGLLFTHEMDAIPNHEWRVLPLLSSLPDTTGELTFLVAHIPIFAVSITFIASVNLKTRKLAQNVACGFLVIHAALHYTFSEHPSYEFSSYTSAFLIYGAALCGVTFFVAQSIERKKDAA